MQTAAKIAIEPIFEADFMPCSFGFRPRRTAHDALQVLPDESFRGARWVVETDIASCFETIPHDRLMHACEERVTDRRLLKLLRAMLCAGVMEQGSIRRSVTVTPQGGAISPLLCNVYLNRLDRQWQARGVGALCRYADDLVVMCKTRSQAERALNALKQLLVEMGLELKQSKTRIVHLREGGEGFDFLGFHHRWVRGRSPGNKHVTFLARWPSREAMQHARKRIRELTTRKRFLLPVEQVCEGTQSVPAWLGRIFPLRKLDQGVRQDQAPCGQPPGVVRGQASRTFGAVGLGDRRPSVPGLHRAV